MAAKTTKNPSKKDPAKKVPKKAPEKAMDIVPALPIVSTSHDEVVANAPNMMPLEVMPPEVMPPEVMPPEVMQQIVKVEKLVGEMKTMADDEVGQNILEYAAIAAGHAREAKTSSALALVSAWVCGVGLNRMKDRLRHGKFGKWRTENIKNCGVSKRSSTRYMQLAAAYGSVRDLLASSSGLTKAYIACGILPDNSPTELSGAKEKPHPTAVLYTGVRKFHASLDLFTKTLDAFGKSKEELSSEDKRQLILIKNELSEFLQRIMEQLP